jgi:hypothetical protein
VPSDRQPHSRRRARDDGDSLRASHPTGSLRSVLRRDY